MRQVLRRSRSLSNEFVNVTNTAAHLMLDDLRLESDALEMSLLTYKGQLIASSTSDTLKIIPRRADDVILQEARANGSYAGLLRDGNKGLHIQIAVTVANLKFSSSPRILYVIYHVSERMSELANSVEITYSQYKKQVFLREPLKDIFVLTLSLVLMLSLLTAVWVAFFSAQRLVSPIRVLAAGTRAVAAGDFDKPLPEVHIDDELGGLVKSFADMTKNLSLARDHASQSQAEIEQQSAYLAAVLAQLSSGVITLNVDWRIRVANNAASQLLDFDVAHMMGEPISGISKMAPHLSGFIQQVSACLDGNKNEWREEIHIKRHANTRIIICQGARFNAEQKEHAGFVLVFDDVTMIMKSQRAAAWGDVARRLAHEVKNPLTPIQLSAERLKRKLLPKLADEDADMLERMTTTIVQQVQTMKHLVKAFAEYARVPKIELQPLYIDTIVNEVLDLYIDDEASVKFATYFSDDHPQVFADADRMRQLLNNLIKNAMESIIDTESPNISVSVTKLDQAGSSMVELRVSDNGPGIPANLVDSLFEPYASSKAKGGGLGLAVVSRIIEEHNGRVFVENTSSTFDNQNSGVTFVVQIPAIDQHEYDDGD